MAEQLRDWLQQEAGRTLNRQRAQVDTAKLLVTFAAGVASTLVATALQVGQVPSLLDKCAATGLALCFMGAVATILTDRMREPDIDEALRMAASLDWSESDLLSHLRRKTLESERFNSTVVDHVRRSAGIQLLSAIASGVLACLSLLA